MTQPEQARVAERAARNWLGDPRYNRYLSLASGSHETALELYLWNARTAAAALIDAGHMEVALRNAYDRALCKAFPSWAVDRSTPLFSSTQGVERARARQHKLNLGSIERLKDARQGHGSNPAHDDVLASLSFGFWASLTVPERTPLVWSPALHRAFPKGTRRSEVHDLVARLVKFRNRLAHNEPVFSNRTGLLQRMEDVYELLTLVAPDVAQYVRSQSKVSESMSLCPVPGLISSQSV